MPLFDKGGLQLVITLSISHFVEGSRAGHNPHSVIIHLQSVTKRSSLFSYMLTRPSRLSEYPAPNTICK